MTSPPRIIALVSVYNEADIIAASVDHLSAQGVGVYLLDDGSTDETLSIARARMGRGIVGVEELPSPGPAGMPRRFSLSRILERKEELARTLDAEWFVNQDADEFRESPWPHLTLAAAIGLVDRLGWNAIDFEVLNFVPGEEEYEPGSDLARVFRRCVPGGAFDRLQVRCWKKPAGGVDLVSSGGHDVGFEGRRVFPIRFPMRHYPIRGEAHGRRKVFQERLDRFDPAERSAGWHVQYDGVVPGGPLTAGWGPAVEYDRDALAVGLQLRHRLVERLIEAGGRLASQRWRLEEETARLAEALRRSEERAATAEASARRAEGLAAGLAAGAEELERRLGEVFASKSWRVTAPLRAVWRWLGGR